MNTSEAKRSNWELWREALRSYGSEHYVVDGETVGLVNDDGLEVAGNMLSRDEAIDFAAWIVAWFGTGEAKP